MRVIERNYILQILIGCICICIFANCGSVDRKADSASVSVNDTGRIEQYDAERAKLLCDQYNAGLLTPTDYRDMLEMVRVAYTRRWKALDSLVNACCDERQFVTAQGELLSRLSMQYPYAEFLANVCDKAAIEQLGEENAKTLKQLKAEMNAAYASHRDSVNKKYHTKDKL